MSNNKERLFIKKIEISNCGRFFGKGHTIYLSDSVDNNITVIVGLSGRGKSTIHDLIYWCFYGEFKNIEPEENQNTDYGLINVDALEKLLINKSVTASVVISLHDDRGEKYRIIRKITATQNKENSETRKFEPLNNSRVSNGIDFETSVLLHFKNDYDDSDTERDPKLIKHHINRFFPQLLSDFFLFDGENLKKFRTQKTSSEFIKNGITKISGLGILDFLIKNSEETATKIENEIGSKNPTSAQFVNQKNQYEDELKNALNDLEKTNNERDGVQSQYDEIMIKITKNKDNNDMAKALERATTNRNAVKKDQKKNDGILQDLLFEMLPQMMMRKTLKDAETIFAQLEEEDKIPPSISSSAIEKILSGNPLKCVCGREFEKNDNVDGPWQTLSNMKDTIIQDDLSQAISLGRNLMSQMINNTSLEKLQHQYDELIDNRRSKNYEITRFNAEIAEYDDAITQNPLYEKDDMDLPKLRKEYQSRLHELSGEITQLEIQIEDFRDKFKRAQQNLEKALGKEHMHTNELNKKQLSKAISKFAKNLEKKIEEKMIQRTQNATESYFLESAPERESFEHVTISKNYDISVQDKNDLNAKLSKGQAHVLGLSYVAGIREITNTKTFLIIDSPLHNISGLARNAIAEVYSKYLPGVQIVLLVTDTEYLQGDVDGAEPVKEILRKTGRVWKEYELERTTIDGVETREIKERNN